MNYNHPIEIVENDVLIVSVLGADGSYFMWQKGLTEDVGSEDGIYFEFDDQINGGHNLVTECTITNEVFMYTQTTSNCRVDDLKIIINSIVQRVSNIG